MKIHWLLIYNFLFLPFICFLLTGMQTSLWLNLMGWFPSPQFWLIILTYIVIHRPFWMSIAFGYLTAILLMGFTAWPFEKLLLSIMIIVGISQLVKDRIYGSGPNYFLALCGMNAVLFQITYILIGYFLENVDLIRFSFFDAVLSPLLSVLFAYPIYQLFKIFDRWTHQELDMKPGKHLI